MVNKTLHYIEAFDHTELLERWIPIMARIEGLQVVCHVKVEYANSLAGNLADYPSIRLESPGKGESWGSYLERISFDNCCLAVIATIGRRPHWFSSLVGRVPYFVVLHNLNYCFDDHAARRPAKSIRDVLRTARDYSLKRLKRRLLAHAHGLLYPSEWLAKEGSRQPFLSHTKHIVIPFAGRHDSSTPPTSKHDRHLMVVVPGTVNARTRDYTLIMDALTVIGRSKSVIEIHLAGRITDLTIVNRLLSAISDGSTMELPAQVLLRCYSDGLSEIQFHQLLTTADVIVAPLRPRIQVGRYYELLGYTKASGTVYDAIYYGKPLLLPSWHPVQNPAVVHFSDGFDLGRILLEYEARRNFPANCWSASSEEDLLKRWYAVIDQVLPSARN